MSTEITFGTDGWRGRIAEDYTFENVRRVSQGFATYLINNDKSAMGVVVGYDMRFHSENFAAAAAEVLAGNGIQVYLTENPTPTPVISYAVVAKKAAAAINITASHNPPTDNGFKVRDEYGGAIAPDQMKALGETMETLEKTKVEEELPPPGMPNPMLPLLDLFAWNNFAINGFDWMTLKQGEGSGERHSTQFKMRLQGIFAERNASQEKLLAQLQDWCHQAEQTGIKALQEFSRSLTRYTLAPA